MFIICHFLQYFKVFLRKNVVIFTMYIFEPNFVF